MQHMKKFRVLNILDTTMEITNQRVAVIELAEVKFKNFDISSSEQFYSFGIDGEKYVIDFNSSLVRSIIDAAQNEEIIELNMSDFSSRIENRDGLQQKIYHHKNLY